MTTAVPTTVVQTTTITSTSVIASPTDGKRLRARAAGDDEDDDTPVTTTTIITKTSVVTSATVTTTVIAPTETVTSPRQRTEFLSWPGAAADTTWSYTWKSWQDPSTGTTNNFFHSWQLLRRDYCGGPVISVRKFSPRLLYTLWD